MGIIKGENGMGHERERESEAERMGKKDKGDKRGVIKREWDWM